MHLLQQYGFSGELLQADNWYYDPTSTPTGAGLVTKYGYDNAKRLVTVKQNINNTGDKLTVSNTYNELGQLQNKAFGTSLDNLQYDYNIRGWVTGINKAYLNTADAAGHYFGMELGYDNGASIVTGTSYTKPAFNGNMAGTTWKTAGDGVDRRYDFGYDNLNRLMSADFNQQSGAVFNKTGGLDFSMTMQGYDANGNIKGMIQYGWKPGGSAIIDNLTYNYNNSEISNRLLAVTENATIGTTDNKLGDFTDKNTTLDDYTYDANNNIITDKNKRITNIHYNYLNLPDQVIFNKDDGSSKGSIVYQYDNMGTKILKTVTDNTTIPAKTSKTMYLNMFVFQDDQLQLFAQDEGRVRWAYHKYLNGSTNNDYEYDFFENDHLGNTRVVLTQQKDTALYMATMETANTTTETALFYNIPASSFAVASVPGTYPTDNTTSPNAYVAKVNGSGQKVGPAIILKVMTGDRFDVAVKSFYHSGGTVAPPNSDVQNILASLANGVFSVTGGAKGSLVDLSNTTTSPLLGALNDFANNKDLTPSDRPKAYLNYIYLDNQFKIAASKAYPLGSSESLVTLGETGIAAPKSGYLYIWVSNETPGWDVFFDNLSVKTYSGALLEETHYYPFGLTMAGISDKALKSNYAENKYRFNKGSELQNKEFSDGSGLEIYETHLRELDPQLGRWWQVDPKIDQGYEDVSPYSAMNNNPIGFSDPMGDEGEACCGGVLDGIRNFTRKVLIFSAAAANAWGTDLFGGVGRADVDNMSGLTDGDKFVAHLGQTSGDAVGVATGGIEVGGAGAGALASGGSATPAAAAVGLHGLSTIAVSGTNLLKDFRNLNSTSNQGSGEGKGSNNLEPDKKEAQGDHSTFKRDKNGDIFKYQEWKKNDRNPKGFDPGRRFDGGTPDGTPGAAHFDRKTGEYIPTPQVQEGKNVRVPTVDELPDNPRFKKK